MALAVVVGLLAHTSPLMHGDDHSAESCPACTLLAAFVLFLLASIYLVGVSSRFQVHTLNVAWHPLLDSLLSQRGPPVTREKTILSSSGFQRM